MISRSTTPSTRTGIAGCRRDRSGILVERTIDAILDPADVPYLFFVAIDDRAHHFSTTLEEHNQAVARYREYRARARTVLPLAPADSPML